MKILYLLIPVIFCQNITFYLSPSGESTNNGLTQETPWKWNWNTVSTSIRKKYSTYRDITLIFLEGDYYVDEYGISVAKMSSSMYFRFWAAPNARVRIIGGKKLPSFSKHSLNPRIWTTQIEETSSSYSLFINNRRVTLARSPKSWEFARLWGYYSSTDPNDSTYVNRHYIVSEELIKILSLLSEEELNRARIVCRHNYHTEKDYIMSIDIKKNEIITNVTKKREDYIKALPITKDALYYVENIFNFLTEPNEYYISPNGTLYFYSEENDDFSKSEAFISTTGWIGFHSNIDHNNRKGNFEVKNIEILGNSNYAVYLSNSDNITLINLTIHNCGGGISVQACNNITINHTYINDVKTWGQYISKSNNIISHNNIIRNFEENHGIEIADCNNSIITNNEIAGGYAAGITVKSHSQYDMKTIRNILVQDNHVHHIGYGVNNDIGAIQVLMETNGLIINHNHFHDIWTESYAGHGIYLGSGTAGTICKNNLVHDTSTSTFKIDLGLEITLENNIWAYGGGSLLYWTTNKPEYHEFNIYHNIFLVVNDKLMGGGGWNDGNPDMTFNNNLYWNVKNGADGFLFRYKNFTEWNNMGHDLNSVFADPMFTDYTKRDFTFKNKKSIKKIGFKEFDYNFGVIGEDYWLKLANSEENNKFHANQVLPPSYFFTSGSTDFEKNDSFWKNCSFNQFNSIIEKTNIKAFNGKKSLRFSASPKQKHSNTRPEFIVPCNYEQGHGIFSFQFYVTNIKNSFLISFDSFLSISISKGTILNGLFTYEENKWNKITLYIDFGDSKTYPTYDIELNGERKTGKEINYTTLSSFKISMIETLNDTYIDNLTTKTDYKIPNYFKNVFNDNSEIFGTIKFEKLFEVNNNLEVDDNINKKIILGIVVGICVCALIALICFIFVKAFMVKKRNIKEAKFIELSNIKKN